jgi:hypothetical protein
LVQIPVNSLTKAVTKHSAKKKEALKKNARYLPKMEETSKNKKALQELEGANID